MALTYRADLPHQQTTGQCRSHTSSVEVGAHEALSRTNDPLTVDPAITPAYHRESHFYRALSPVAVVIGFFSRYITVRTIFCTGRPLSSRIRQEEVVPRGGCA